MIRKAFALLLSLGMMGGIISCIWADDHIVSESKRTYMGRTVPMPPTEIWIGENSSCIRFRSIAIIVRIDLQKKWTLNMTSKKYLEEPLGPSAEKSQAEEKTFRIQEYGYDYEPVYEWIIEKTGETQLIDGKECTKIVLYGDADYSEEVREMWLTKDVPIDLKRYFERMVKPDLDGQLLQIYQSTPLLREGLAFKFTTTTENPIASTSIMEGILSKVETAEPPEGIYELPPDFERVKTREELYARQGG